MNKNCGVLIAVLCSFTVLASCSENAGEMHEKSSVNSASESTA